jgi:hypothetical protein
MAGIADGDVTPKGQQQTSSSTFQTVEEVSPRGNRWASLIIKSVARIECHALETSND